MQEEFDYNEVLSIIRNSDQNDKTNGFIVKGNKIFCGYCGGSKVKSKNNHLLVCIDCKTVEEVIINSGEESDEAIDGKMIKKPSQYQKKSHFDTLMFHFEMKRSYKVPKKIITMVNEYIKRSSLDPRTLWPRDIVDILKILKLNKYYTHYTYIYSRVTGNRVPVISENDKQKIYLLFNVVTKTWTKVIPVERSNFLNYKYTMRKILEILNLHEFYKFFPYPKNDEKLMELDYYWSLICDYHGDPIIFKPSERLLRLEYIGR